MVISSPLFLFGFKSVVSLVTMKINLKVKKQLEIDEKQLESNL